MYLRRIAWVAVAFFGLQPSCGGAPEGTAILVRIEADDAMVERADALRVRVFDSNRLLVLDREEALSARGGAASIPASVPLFPEGELPRTFHLVAELLDDGAPFARQQLVGGFRDGAAVVVPLRFEATCMDRLDCTGLETCVAGACVGACYDAGGLVSDRRPPPVACDPVVFVDPDNGADEPRDCQSPAAPCATVEHAQTFLIDGEGGLVLLRGEMVHPRFHVRVGGNATSPVVFRPWPGTGTPVVDGGGADGGAIHNCCSDTAHGHLVIEDLEVRNGYGKTVYLHGSGSTDVVLRGLDVHSTVFQDGIDFGVQTGGIVLTNGASDIVVERNWVHDNVGRGLSDDAGSIGTAGISSANAGDGIVITDNLVEDNAGTAIRASGAVLVARNVARNNGEDGLSGLPSRTIVEHNLVCNNQGTGIRIVSADAIQIRHNAVLRSGGPGLTLSGWASDNVVVDNVIAFGADAGIAWIQGTSGTGAPEPAGSSEPADDYNVLFMNAAGDARDVELGENNRMGDPGLEGVEACDVRLASDSPLRGTASDGTDAGPDLAALRAVVDLGVTP